MKIRKAEMKDLTELLKLYAQLNDLPISDADKNATECLERITENENQYILVAEEYGKVCATVTITIIESLTHGIRPYGVVEHVITDEKYRGKGLAGALLETAENIAKEKGCYKIMLITGRQEESVHRLYKKAGFKSESKTAYVMELN